MSNARPVGKSCRNPAASNVLYLFLDERKRGPYNESSSDVFEFAWVAFHGAGRDSFPSGFAGGGGASGGPARGGPGVHRRIRRDHAQHLLRAYMSGPCAVRGGGAADCFDGRVGAETGGVRRAVSSVFHSMENFFAIFPHNGKNFSTLWKTFFRACCARGRG